jgi:dienelactone hydrolase
MLHRKNALLAAALIVGLVALGGRAQADVIMETVEYEQGGQVLEGTLAYDDAVPGQRPGVVVFHAWRGPGEHEMDSARRLAERGYAAFVADVYGKGVRAANNEEAAQLASKYREDRELMQARALAAIETLRNAAQADPGRLFAIGYCFGGGVALESARAGAELLAVVSFHGSLSTPHPEAMADFGGTVLALHGAADPHVPPEEVAAFQKELSDAGVDWIFTSYGGAVHSFTDPGADSETARYEPKAAARSWRDMHDLFGELLGTVPE